MSFPDWLTDFSIKSALKCKSDFRYHLQWKCKFWRDTPRVNHFERDVDTAASPIRTHKLHQLVNIEPDPPIQNEYATILHSNKKVVLLAKIVKIPAMYYILIILNKSGVTL